MCIIESLNALKPMISCIINIKSYITSKLFTRSPLTAKSRENVIELLLINHPVDCVTCDQSGGCDLQDYSLVFGFVDKRFYNYKREIEDIDIINLIKTSMSRCIHCTKCIRFSSEITGFKEIGMLNRGFSSIIGVYNLNNKLTSELAGNLIDLCPVASLNLK